MITCVRTRVKGHLGNCAMSLTVLSALFLQLYINKPIKHHKWPLNYRSVARASHAQNKVGFKVFLPGNQHEVQVFQSTTLNL